MAKRNQGPKPPEELEQDGAPETEEIEGEETSANADADAELAAENETKAEQAAAAEAAKEATQPGPDAKDPVPDLPFPVKLSAAEQTALAHIHLDKVHKFIKGKKEGALLSEHKISRVHSGLILEMGDKKSRNRLDGFSDGHREMLAQVHGHLVKTNKIKA